MTAFGAEKIKASLNSMECVARVTGQDEELWGIHPLRALKRRT
jgi:hypothetical protein